MIIRSICQNLVRIKPRASPISYGSLLSTSSRRPIAELDKTTHIKSLTISYLQKSCGLSLESAISASEKLSIDSTDKPDSVLNLLRTVGLTQPQIKNLITKRPSLLLADSDHTLKPNVQLFESLGFTGTSLDKILNKEPRVLEGAVNTTVEFFRNNGFNDTQIKKMTMKRSSLYVFNVEKCLKPKLEYFKSLGFSELEMAKFLSAEPYILERSLEKQIIPCIQTLRRILDNDDNVLKAIKAGCPILECNVEKVLEPSISILVNQGVPKSLVLKLILIQPRALLLSSDRLNEIIGKVKKLGFDPTNLLFVLAIRSMAVMSKEYWEKKLEAYMSFGLTKDEVYSAFKRQPMCMIVSEQKIRKLMDFYVNKLSLEPLIISKNPNILLLSLEKRILPRCSVLQLLMSKELIKRDLSLPHMFKMTEKQFVEKVVKKFEDKLPEIVKAYQGKIEFTGSLK